VVVHRRSTSSSRRTPGSRLVLYRSGASTTGPGRSSRIIAVFDPMHCRWAGPDEETERGGKKSAGGKGCKSLRHGLGLIISSSQVRAPLRLQLRLPACRAPLLAPARQFPSNGAAGHSSAAKLKFCGRADVSFMKLLCAVWPCNFGWPRDRMGGLSCLFSFHALHRTC
jgi:hypothetical protein